MTDGRTERDYPCVVDFPRCPNKVAYPDRFSPACHGSLDQRCYVNWGSTDPEDVEPYEEYLAALEKREERG